MNNLQKTDEIIALSLGLADEIAISNQQDDELAKVMVSVLLSKLKHLQNELEKYN